MNCSHCDIDVVVFAVPDELETHAPDGHATATVCPHCLAVTAAADETPADDPAFDRIDESFPAGEGGAALALLVNTLPSIALRKEAARACREYAEANGVDVELTLDRLVDAVHDGEIVPEFDLERRAYQLDSLLAGGT